MVYTTYVGVNYMPTITQRKGVVARHSFYGDYEAEKFQQNTVE